jgi:hypothetical protein
MNCYINFAVSRLWLHDRYFPTVLIVLLAVFNDGAMIALSKDRVIASRTPNRWDLRSIFTRGALRPPTASSSVGLPEIMNQCAAF